MRALGSLIGSTLGVLGVIFPPLNFPLIALRLQVLRTPYPILVPLIPHFCITVAYSLNSNIYEVFLMAIFGRVENLMRKFKYEPAPFMLAIVLVDLVETNSRQSLLYSEGDPPIFFKTPHVSIGPGNCAGAAPDALKETRERIGLGGEKARGITG
jgi:TctA family transporter